MSKLMTTLLVVTAMAGSFAFADDSSTNADSAKIQSQWGKNKASFNDTNKTKVIDIVDSIFNESNGLAGNAAPGGQIDQSSVGTQE